MSCSDNTAATGTQQPRARAGDDADQEVLFALASQVAESQAMGLVNTAAETTKKIPILGALADSLGESYDAAARFSMRKTDDLVASNAASMINSIGVTLLNSLHDHAMPQGVHRVVDDAYGHTWPQMKKSLMDSVMLSAGLEFRAFQQAQMKHDPEPPSSLLKRIGVRLIYAMEPYDLTIWGTIRSPLSLLIQLAFLFPLYGVSDMLVILLAVAKYNTNFNEFGLVNFVISSKKLQFITTGLFSGSYAFIKLFVCATVREKHHADEPHDSSAFACENFAPGTHPTFPFEMCLFVLRCALNWVIFAMLWNYEAVAAKKKSDEQDLAQQRLLAGVERRGLYGPCLTGLFLLATWPLFAAVIVAAVAAVYLTNIDPASPSEGMSDQGWWLDISLDISLIAWLSQMSLHGLLTRPAINSDSSRHALIGYSISSLYLLVRLNLPALTDTPTPANVTLPLRTWAGYEVDATISADDLAHLPATICLGINGVALLICTGLLVMQRRARRRDDEQVKRLRVMIDSLNADRDGSVSKVELRMKYDVFLGHPAAAATGDGASVHDDEQGDVRETMSFEQFWSQLDANQDGRVALTELASHYGVSHLVAPAYDRRGGEGLSHLDPQYLDKRLEELHEREFGRIHRWPGGALLYFVIWDVLAFAIASAAVLPFLYGEVIAGELVSFSDVINDWRIRCGLYFLKIVIALLAFPFLVFAMPLMQGWLTHVKPTGYDRAGNCVPSLSSSQIKQKFRNEYIAKKNDPRLPASYEGVWDRVLGVDPEAELAIENGAAPTKKGGKLSVVEAARMRRINQARRERLPEASLFFGQRVNDGGPLDGKLQVTVGSELMML